MKLKLHSIVAIGLLSFCAGVSPLAAQTTVDLLPSRDNTLYERAAGDVSNALGTALIVGRTNQGADFLRRALIAFDVAGSIPAGATIVSASLSMEMTLTISGEQNIGLHRVTASWGEGTSQDLGNGGMGVAASAGDATWTDRFFGAGMPWTTPGGDFAGAASTDRLVGGPDPYTWPSSPDTVADVQDWLDNPGDNHGWILIGNEADPATAKRFESREGTEPPRLTVTYAGGTAPAAPIPTASTWGLALLGALLIAVALRRL